MTEETRSADYEQPTSEQLAVLGLSPEVHWYLWSRGIPIPLCPPKWKTPEPRDLPGAMFNPDRVDRVLAAFDRLVHTQGKWAGLALKPDPWQVGYILAPVFGWVHKDSSGEWVRIIRKVYIDVPRKNGKTTIAGGVAVYLTGGDREKGAQVLAAAASKEQAKYCFSPIKTLVEKSPALKGNFRTLAGKVLHDESGSYFTAVSAIADLLHGANVHGAVVDELHVHKSKDLLEAIETGTGSRSQPLIVIITTADASKPGTVYDGRRKLIESLANGALKDESTYGVIWAADKDDDPLAEETWKKANPGYGVSPTKEFMESAAKAAKNSPAEMASFLRLHLGIRTRQQTRYIELADWDRNAGMVDPIKLKGHTAYGGLDLASTSDLTAVSYVFPDGEGGYDILWRHFLPEAAFAKFDERVAGNGDVWVRRGLLELTPGNVADYDFVRARIRTDADLFHVVEIGYDPWNATQLVTDLIDDGMPMVPVRQGFRSMSPPLKELQRLVLSGTEKKPVVRHGGNQLVRWQVDNLAVAMDPAGNVKPDKASAGDKIDGVVAAVIALDRASRHQAVPERRSAYEDGDLQVV